MKSPLYLILLLCLAVSCTSPEDRAIEATLTFAGANRAELEKVLHHYQHPDYIYILIGKNKLRFCV